MKTTPRPGPAPGHPRLDRPAGRRGWLGVLLGAGLAAGSAHACLGDGQVAEMFSAYAQAQPAPNPPALSAADGECTRAKFNRLLALQYGEPVGYKAGLTNPAVQRRFNHGSPVWGLLYGPMLLADGASVPVAFGARPLYEADLLVRVSDRAINQARTPAEVLQAVDQIIPFIELPDLVVQAPGQLNGAAITAINVGARLGVMGAPLAVPVTRGERHAWLDALRDMTVIVSANGIEQDRGQGRDVLDHPLNAVVWLVQDIAREQRSLRPGDLVSLGSFSRLLPPQAGTQVEVAYWGLPGTPRVRVRFP